MLKPGRTACGFAVGEEPLTSMFASFGVQVLATDAPDEGSPTRWQASGQHAASIDALFNPRLVSREAFGERVKFRPVDMRDIADLPRETFDFLWSSCAIEHLGTLESGLEFVQRSTALLKPGGVAVHTTEYNVSSDDDTVTEGAAVIYRRHDLEKLDRQLRHIGSGVAKFDFDAGTHRYDLEFDYPPYKEHGRKHLKLLMDGYVVTSILLVIHKGAPI